MKSRYILLSLLAAFVCKSVSADIPEGNIIFVDEVVKSICVANWDTNGDGELSYAEAAAVDDEHFSGCTYVFSNNKTIQSFNELQYFTGITSIGSYSFYDCISLTSLTIPEGVTTIGEGAFSNCRSLTVNFPSTIQTINKGFIWVQRVNLSGVIPPTISDDAFWPWTVFCVPASAKSAYLNADTWKDHTSQIMGVSEYNEVELNNVEAREDCSVIRNAIGDDNLEDVYSLTVSGSINGYDFLVMRQKMPNLRYLDLKDALIVANDFEYYTGYHSEADAIGAYAFYKTNLHSIIMPSSIDRIGGETFGECGNLSHVEFNEGLRFIEGGAFDRSGLTTVAFPESLESIGGWAFWGAGIKNIVLPNNVKNVEGGCFKDCPLEYIELSEKLENIGGLAFEGSDGGTGRAGGGLSVIAKTPDPLAIPDGVFGKVYNATLYVRDQQESQKKYYWAPGWSDFLKFGEYHCTGDFYLINDNTVGDGKEVFEGKDENGPDADLRPESGFIKDGPDDLQQLDNVEQNISDNGTGASIIATDNGESIGNLNINHLKIKIEVQADKWYYFCFPFDVAVASCQYPGQHAWRYYDGAEKANGNSGWKAMESSTLNARQGYAFRCKKSGELVISYDHPTFGGNRTKSLTAYTAANAQNANWNFVGNPYSSYYDFQSSDFTAPITVWDGTHYVAYRPGDDDCHLRPYEAFFVQKPDAVNEISFNAERRETYQQSNQQRANQLYARRALGITPERRLLNLYVTDNDTSIIDRTRVVLNEQKSRNYELDCDASKFLSNEAKAQLYSIENGVQMAINERPQQGDIRLGYTSAKAGTLSISSSRMDMPMVLVDTKLGTTFDLSLGSYDFDTQAGTFNDRFLLRQSGEATAINDITKKTGVCIGTQDGGIAIGGAEGKIVNVYTTGGAQAAQHSGNGFVALSRGVYVVSVDGVSAKVNVR